MRFRFRMNVNLFLLLFHFQVCPRSNVSWSAIAMVTFAYLKALWIFELCQLTRKVGNSIRYSESAFQLMLFFLFFVAVADES